MNEDRIKKIISARTRGTTTFSVEFHEEEPGAVAQAFLELESIAQSLELIKQLRKLCRRTDEGLFVPLEETANQMQKVCLSAAASFPYILPRSFIEEKLEVPYNSYKVYAGAKKFDSRLYLSFDEDKGLKISLEGIPWVASLFESELVNLSEGD
ncbi:MAG: hypothetical protein GF309_13500 [Candidatus Lokiarchaeota archaeon]|nr:hypothetical protein [Candidatus Lokiarchaeota archaeon]